MQDTRRMIRKAFRWSWDTLAQVLTCRSTVADSGSFAVAVQGYHSDVVVRVGEQLLQQGRGGGPWYQNLHGDTKQVSNQHCRVWKLPYVQISKIRQKTK